MAVKIRDSICFIIQRSPFFYYISRKWRIFMKRSTIITIVAFAVGLVVLSAAFILLTDNNISNSLFSTTTAPSTTTTTTGVKLENEPMDFFKTDVKQYVQLGQYKDIELEVEMLEVPDDYIQKQINVLLFQKNMYEKIEKDASVTDGVIFNFDFTGYINGVKFEGGSGTNTFAYIDGDDFITVTTSGTGRFIDGFAQGTLGAAIGEEIEVPVTFPEDYHDKDYAGKDATFKVKVNYILKTELTDERASTISNKKYETAEAFKTYLKEGLNENLTSMNNALLWDKIVENSKFIEIPKQEFDYMFELLTLQIKSLMNYGLTYENALQYYGFENEDALKEYINDIIKEELVVYAIMQENEISVTDEEYRARLAELAKEAGKSEEEYLQTNDEEYIRQQIMMDKTEKLVLESNSFVLAK